MSLPRDQARLRFFWTWHRRVGIVAALLVLVLSVTGLALNHTERLGLDERFATAGWLLDWYGIRAPDVSVTYTAGGSRVTLLGDRLYLDAGVLPGHFGRLAGAVASAGFIAVAADGEILVLTPDGQLVDRMGAESGIPPDVDALGLGPDGAVFLRAGEAMYSARIDTLDWSRSPDDDTGIRWSAPGSLPAGEFEALQADFRSRILPVERVILDVHSGRIAGKFGTLLMDGAAVLLLLLALTGSWLWLRRRGQR